MLLLNFAFCISLYLLLDLCAFNMSYKINSIDEYKLYIKQQLSETVKDEKKQAMKKKLSKIVKNEKKLEDLVDEYFISFCDGVNFGRGDLRVEV